ncbi:MAG: GGDEF domain-containing protein [Gammaproteobacteria bacterium]|nr:GGDEF domain-containing protein [Gammaproteobacteria bacterium]
MTLLPRGFRAQLLLAFTGLLTVTAVGVGIAVSVTSSSQVLAQMERKVLVGSHVLDSFLDARREQLDAAVRVLTNDFGFRAAVATGDTPTISSTLDNHGRRIGADLMVLVDDDGAVVTSDPTRPRGRQVPFAHALDQARETGSAAAIGAYDGSLYQYFVVPVLAPEPVAWVVVAFAIDRAIARELAALTDLEVTFAGLDAGGAATTMVSTLAADVAGSLLPALRTRHADAPEDVVRTHEGAYLGAIRRLGGGDAERVFAALQMPTRVVDDTVWLVVGQITVALAIALALTLTLSLWLARRISEPISRLITSARRIERGEYDTPVALAGGGEMALLGSALATMQQGIRDREAHIRHQADHDDVTGLPNRRHLARFCEDHRAPFTLCLLALTDIKNVRFSFGHDAADALLVAVGDRLSEDADVAMVARVSGHEFALVLPACSADAALDRARALRSRAAGPHPVMGHRLDAAVTCAVIAFPEDAADFQTLFRGAETSLELAGEQPDGCVAYLPGHEALRARQLEIIASFETACRDGQLSLRFQPKVDLGSGTVSDCEALLRWEHPTLGFVPPDEFILLAERSGNIRRLSDWVLDAAVGQIAAWRDDGLTMTVAVNLSAHDLADPGLPDIIRATLARHGVDAGRLVLEVTESAVMRDPERAAASLRALKAMGSRLSIDDFGTGQSSLAQLKRLPVDELKIDKSFVLELDTSDDDALIVSSTIELGHNLGLAIVAEGVENAASLDMLTGYGCDKVQGYHFSRPLPADEFVAWTRAINGTSERAMGATGT